MNGPGPAGRLAPRPWQVVVGFVAAVLLVLGVSLLIARAAGFAEVRDALRRADSTWFGVCLAAQVVALAAYADLFRGGLRWRDAPDPGFRLSAEVMLASIGATRVFAAGGAGAIAVTYWCFRRARFPADEALVRVLGFNTLLYVPFGVGAWIAAVLVAASVWGGEEAAALTLPWLVLVPLCFAAAWFVTQPGRVDRLTDTSGSFVRRALAYAIAGTAWVRYALGERAGGRMLGSSLLYWLGNVACMWAALKSVGQALPLPELVLAFAIGQVAMFLPLPLGGVGGVDAAMTYALTAVDVPLATALVAVGVYRLFAFWAPTIPALAALVLLPHAGTRLGRLRPGAAVP